MLKKGCFKSLSPFTLPKLKSVPTHHHSKFSIKKKTHKHTLHNDCVNSFLICQVCFLPCGDLSLKKRYLNKQTKIPSFAVAYSNRKQQGLHLNWSIRLFLPTPIRGETRQQQTFFFFLKPRLASKEGMHTSPIFKTKEDIGKGKPQYIFMFILFTSPSSYLSLVEQEKWWLWNYVQK